MRLRTVFVYALIGSLAPFSASAALLEISPASGAVTVGGEITVRVSVASPDEALNAISGTLSFPPEVLSVASVSKTASVISLWVQEPAYANSEGSINWSGVVPNPGYSGGARQVLAVTFRARRAGIASITFSNASVLANDGSGTNILSASKGATITVAAPAPTTIREGPSVSEPSRQISTPNSYADPVSITSETHPDESRWFNNPTATFHWSNPVGAVAVKLGYGNNPAGVPQVTYSPPINEKTLTLNDGVTYFSEQIKTESGWTAVARYRVQIDTVPPDPFTVRITQGSVGTPSTANFTTTDTLSGIDYYEVLLNDRVVARLSSQDIAGPISLPTAPAGTTTLEVFAYDNAGNVSHASARFQSFGPDEIHAALISNPLNGAWAHVLFAAGLWSIGILLALACAYFLRRTQMYRRRMLRRIAKTDQVLHAEFADLLQVVTEEVSSLKEIRLKRDLTTEEDRFLKRFSHLLAKSEHILESELIDLAHR